MKWPTFFFCALAVVVTTRAITAEDAMEYVKGVLDYIGVGAGATDANETDAVLPPDQVTPVVDKVDLVDVAPKTETINPTPTAEATVESQVQKEQVETNTEAPPTVEQETQTDDYVEPDHPADDYEQTVDHDGYDDSIEVENEDEPGYVRSDL